MHAASGPQRAHRTHSITRPCNQSMHIWSARSPRAHSKQRHDRITWRARSALPLSAATRRDACGRSDTRRRSCSRCSLLHERMTNSQCCGCSAWLEAWCGSPLHHMIAVDMQLLGAPATHTHRPVNSTAQQPPSAAGGTCRAHGRHTPARRTMLCTRHP